MVTAMVVRVIGGSGAAVSKSSMTSGGSDSGDGGNSGCGSGGIVKKSRHQINYTSSCMTFMLVA